MSDERFRVLVIDDEEDHAEVVAESLRRVGYECAIATSGADGAKKIEKEEFDVVLTDLRMDGMDGLAILRKARQELPDAEVVLITGHGDVKTAVEAMREGAADYLQKPVNMAELRAVMDKTAKGVRLTRSNRELKQHLDEKFGFEGVVGNSQKMHEVIARLKTIVPTNATVLIQGETGTGKELVARAIHINSPRRNKPFVAMNCTALNENLLEDELFGHEPGSFTGADKLRKGRFEYANGGTLFLDEVGDMPLALQSKLLRVLENQEVFRIGSNEPIKVNVRLISATNRDLEAAVTAGTFRQDLYFRLKVITVKLPPLRERRDDVPILALHFVREFNQRHGKHVKQIAPPVLKAMREHGWPGNVRELRNLIESMVVTDQDGELNWDDLQEGESLGVPHHPPRNGPGPVNLVGRPLTEVERYHIEQTLAMTNGNRVEAARLLGIGERTLYRSIQEFKLQDNIRQALEEAGGDMGQAAQKLGMSEQSLQRKIKKWGLPVEAE